MKSISDCYVKLQKHNMSVYMIEKGCLYDQVKVILKQTNRVFTTELSLNNFIGQAL